MTNALYSTRTIPVEHVTISSTKPFEEVRAKLATLAPHIDDGIFTLLRYGESTRDIGNPLTASKMTRHQLSAGLYEPIRVLLREDGDGGAAFEYDRPASVFGQYGNDEVDAVAQKLDHDLRGLLEAAAT
jgi:hypothetical protein